MIKLEGYDTEETFVFINAAQMMNFISERLGENWYFMQDIVCDCHGLPAFIVRR